METYQAHCKWIRWRKEFLWSLQTRSKWNNKCRNLQKGDIVLLKTEASRNQWPVVKVIRVNADDLGFVGSVRLLLASSWDSAGESIGTTSTYDSTGIFSNCSFSSIKFCKISSVCSQVSFSTLAISSILRLSRRDLSLRSLSLSQSWSLSFQSSLMSSLCFCFCLLRLSSTFWNFFWNTFWDVSNLFWDLLFLYWVFLTFHYCLEFLLRVDLISQLCLSCKRKQFSWSFLLAP